MAARKQVCRFHRTVRPSTRLGYRDDRSPESFSGDSILLRPDSVRGHMVEMVPNVGGRYEKEALQRNRLDGWCHYPARRSDVRVFDVTGAEGIPLLLRLGCCLHTVGSTTYNESVSG